MLRYIHKDLERACVKATYKNGVIFVEMTGEGDTGRKQHAYQTGHHWFLHL